MTGASKSESIESSSGSSSWNRTLAPTPLAKRALDVVLSGAGLVAALPMGLCIAAAIKMTDGGPVFFSQQRVGKGGEPFTSYKFRSMVPDADEKFGCVQATEHDPRVTPIGRLLRRTAMDELPQLWNIFTGDMSFVGPRALATAEVEVNGTGEAVEAHRIPGYSKRHTVVPGLTGIAQIYAPRDVPRRHKFRFDRVYVDNASLWLDVKLICLSFWITFRGKWEVREKKL